MKMSLKYFVRRHYLLFLCFFSTFVGVYNAVDGIGQSRETFTYNYFDGKPRELKSYPSYPAWSFDPFDLALGLTLLVAARVLYLRYMQTP